MDRLPRARSTTRDDASDGASYHVIRSPNKTSASRCFAADGLPYCTKLDDRSPGYSADCVVGLPDGALSLDFSTNDGINSIPYALGMRSRTRLHSLIDVEDELFEIERSGSRASYYSSSSSTWYNEHFEIDPRTSPRPLTDPNTVPFPDVWPVYQGSPHSAVSSELYGEDEDDTYELEQSVPIATELAIPISSWELSLPTTEPWRDDHDDYSLRFAILGDEDDYLDVIEPLTAAAEGFLTPPYPIENPFPSSPVPSPTNLDDDTDVNISVSFSANDLIGTHPVSTSHITSPQNMSIRTQTHIEDCKKSEKNSIAQTFSQKLTQLVRGRMMGSRSRGGNRTKALSPSSQCCTATTSTPLQIDTSAPVTTRRRYTLSIEVEVDVPVTVITSTEHHPSSPTLITLPSSSPTPTSNPLSSDRTILAESLPRDSVDTTMTTGTTVCIDSRKPKADGPLDKLLRRMKRRTWNGAATDPAADSSHFVGDNPSSGRRGPSFALEDMTGKQMEELRRQMRRYST